MVKYELRLKSFVLKAWKHELKFKSASSDPRVTSSNPRVKSSNPRITKWNQQFKSPSSRVIKSMKAHIKWTAF